MTGLIVDNFAGGGGASTGIEQALGRAVDIAINHDEQAIRMHEVNHPGTRHIRNNIWQIDPQEVTAGQPVHLAWFSPDCKHFSKAKGGKPREKSIRDLAWVVVLWAQRVKPDVILLENVEEFRTWGPLDDEGQPIKARAGETFDKWCRELRKAGYKLQFRELRACDYGAPTIRKRFFMIARSDGCPIVWPEPSHGKPGSPEVLSGKRLPWRTAAEIIDWSIPCPSIFERKKPLADKTLRRIAHGIVKFVLDNPRPFIVPNNTNNVPKSIDDPVPTITTGNRNFLVSPHVTKFRSGAIGHEVSEPLATVTANSFIKRPGGSAPLGVVQATLEHAEFACSACGEANARTWWPTCEWCGHEQDELIAPFFARTAHGDVDSKGKRRGKGQHPAGEPFPTIATSQDSALIAAHLIHQGNGEREGQAPRAMDVEKPLGTVVASGEKHAAVCAFMQKFADNGRGVDPAEPLHTVMAGAPRHAVVCAHIEQANGSPEGEKPLPGRAADDPLSTIVAKGCTQRLVTSNLVKLRGTCAHGQPVEEPLATVSAGGTHMAEVRAFLLKYYGNESEGHDPAAPLGTVTTKDRFGLVTVTIEGEEYVIVDIGMRMLTPRELFNAQGFPADYIIDHDAEGRPITKTAQVAKCGNSVCPPIARALVFAQLGREAAEQDAEAA
jgi:DNA (cytosine-5)-methyltransferase 1